MQARSSEIPSMSILLVVFGIIIGISAAWNHHLAVELLIVSNVTVIAGFGLLYIKFKGLEEKYAKEKIENAHPDY